MSEHTIPLYCAQCGKDVDAVVDVWVDRVIAHIVFVDGHATCPDCGNEFMIDIKESA